MLNVKNPHRVYEDLPVAAYALPQPTKEFITDFLKVVAWCIDQPDKNVRKLFNLPPEPYGVPEEPNRAALLQHASTFVGNAAQHWEWLYNNLADDDSKLLLLTVVAYRALGWRYVRMPLNNEAFWDVLRTFASAEASAPPEDRIQTQSTRLTRMNLASIGYDVSFFADAFGVFNEFLYSQYSYRGRRRILTPQYGDYVIDCGACYGGTSLFFASMVGDAGRVFSFEFFPDNLEVFKRNRQLNSEIASRITVVEAPLWTDEGHSMSIQGKGPATQVFMSPPSADGTVEPPRPGEQRFISGSIDKLVERNNLARLDFIKMDIEGAEMMALRGATETLKRFKPVLAISVYHKLIDFYEIPQEIDKLGLGYKFYFQHSTLHGDETVVFADARRSLD
jgi:FkbM family methyltransferase